MHHFTRLAWDIMGGRRAGVGGAGLFLRRLIAGAAAPGLAGCPHLAGFLLVTPRHSSCHITSTILHNNHRSHEPVPAMAIRDIPLSPFEDHEAEQEGTNTNTPTMSAEDQKPRAAPPPGIPVQPDGGLDAWLQVFGGFFVYFNTWGLIITFGVFQSYYQNHLLTHYSPSQISWIGTIQGFLLVEVGIISGPLYDHGHLRYLIAAGAFFLVLGLMMTSLAEDYYSIFLSLGVCTGLGMGFVFFPGITSISTYFTTRRGLANGIAASGSALGMSRPPNPLWRILSDRHKDT